MAEVALRHCRLLGMFAQFSGVPLAAELRCALGRWLRT